MLIWEKVAIIQRARRRKHLGVSAAGGLGDGRRGWKPSLWGCGAALATHFRRRGPAKRGVAGWRAVRDNKQDKTRKGGQVPEYQAPEREKATSPRYQDLSELDTYLDGPLPQVIVILMGFLN